MKMLSRVLLLILSTAMISCRDSSQKRLNVTLIVPDSFRGEVFLIEDMQSGQDWRMDAVRVSKSGIARVKDLSQLAAFPPAEIKAQFANGSRMGNSVLQTGNEVSLWPISYVDDRLLYFVVGTWDEKTDRENARIRGNWRELYQKISTNEQL